MTRIWLTFFTVITLVLIGLGSVSFTMRNLYAKTGIFGPVGDGPLVIPFLKGMTVTFPTLLFLVGATTFVAVAYDMIRGVVWEWEGTTSVDPDTVTAFPEGVPEELSDSGGNSKTPADKAPGDKDKPSEPPPDDDAHDDDKGE